MKNNTKNLAVLTFVMFSFCICISSAQAKLSQEECFAQGNENRSNSMKKVGALDPKDKTSEFIAGQIFYKYYIYQIKLFEGQCAHYDYPDYKTNAKAEISDAKNSLASLSKNCLKLTGKEDCGSNQASNNITANNPKANNSSSVKSTSSTNDAAEASKVLASFGTSSQSKSCLRQKPRGDDLVITDACPSPNRHVDTNFFYCLVGIKDAKRNDAECGGPKFSKWIGGGEHGEANRYASRQIRNKSDTYISSRGAKKLMMTACRTPYTPTNISYSQQGGLTSECKWCDSWLKDGKNTCAKEIKTLQNN